MGNLGCGCTELQREDMAIENILNLDYEEVIEFQPGKRKNPIITPISQSLLESKRSTFDSYSGQFDIQGEMSRVQKAIKEIFVPRWCVLNSKTFKYFKNQYSALCKEKPLFEVNIEKFTSGRAYTLKTRYYIEFSFARPLSAAEFLLAKDKRYVSKPTSEISSQKLSKNSSFSSMQIAKTRVPTTETETLLFIVSDREEWEKWSKAILACLRSNY